MAKRAKPPLKRVHDGGPPGPPVPVGPPTRGGPIGPPSPVGPPGGVAQKPVRSPIGPPIPVGAPSKKYDGADEKPRYDGIVFD